MAVARPQLFFFHILPIQPIKQKRSLGFYWQDRVNDEEKRGKEILCIFFWQHRVCEVVRFHAWVQPAHQFGFGNVQRISQVKNTTGESTKVFAKLKEKMKLCWKLTSQPKVSFPADGPSAAGFWSCVCSKERLACRSFQLEPRAIISGFVVQSPCFLQFIFICNLSPSSMF